jgi:hypothetical protein
MYAKRRASSVDVLESGVLKTDGFLEERAGKPSKGE